MCLYIAHYIAQAGALAGGRVAAFVIQLAGRLAGMCADSIDRDSLTRVVAIANGKGGVGKTSLCTTLAGLSGAAGYRVLLIDLDPQGNAGEDLGYTSAGLSDDGQGMVTAITGGGDLRPTITACRENLDVICGGEHLDDLSGVLLARHRRGLLPADALARPLSRFLASTEYDLVLIDCPPGEPNLQLLALGAARWLIIPTRADAASLRGMKRIVERLVEARQSNPALDLLGVALFDLPSSATRVRAQIEVTITEALGGAAPLFTTPIRHSMSAIAARGQGLLVHEFAEQTSSEPWWQALREGRRPTTPGSAPSLAADYGQLAHEVLVRISNLEDL